MALTNLSCAESTAASGIALRIRIRSGLRAGGKKIAPYMQAQTQVVRPPSPNRGRTQGGLVSDRGGRIAASVAMNRHPVRSASPC